MSITVAVEQPTTPVTEGSDDVAMCSGPNMCKMPGPPAPFVPTHFPNLGRSADKLTDGTSTVKIQGKKVAIRGAHYFSSGSPDVASKGTGGGVVSSRAEGKTEFIAPGATTVKAEGKNVQLLGDAMTNNGGSPANSVCAKNAQKVADTSGLTLAEIKVICDAFCQAQKDYTDGKKVARGRGAVTRHFQDLVAKAQKAGKLRPNPPLALQPEAWMFKAAGGIAYRALTATALQAVTLGHGGMGRMIGASVGLGYWQLGTFVPNLFRPDLVARIGSNATALEAKFFWDKTKDKLTPKQVRAAAKMKGKFVQMKPDGSNGSPCKCPKAAIPPAHR